MNKVHGFGNNNFMSGNNLILTKYIYIYILKEKNTIYSFVKWLSLFYLEQINNLAFERFSVFQINS